MSLTRDQILTAKDLRTESVEVPEWGGTVLISMLSMADRLAYEEWSKQQSDESQEHLVKLLALTLVDSDGARVFDEGQTKDLLSRNPDVLLRLGRIAIRVNKITDAEVTAAKGES